LEAIEGQDIHFVIFVKKNAPSHPTPQKKPQEKPQKDISFFQQISFKAASQGLSSIHYLDIVLSMMDVAICAGLASPCFCGCPKPGPEFLTPFVFVFLCSIS